MLLQHGPCQKNERETVRIPLFVDDQGLLLSVRAFLPDSCLSVVSCQLSVVRLECWLKNKPAERKQAQPTIKAIT